MGPGKPPRATGAPSKAIAHRRCVNALGAANKKIFMLTDTLREPEQRLEEVTGGEMDSVTDRGSRTFVLRRAKDRLRQSKARQAGANLNALPASFVILESQGTTIYANGSWQRFSGASAIQVGELGSASIVARCAIPETGPEKACMPI